MSACARTGFGRPAETLLNSFWRHAGTPLIPRAACLPADSFRCSVEMRTPSRLMHLLTSSSRTRQSPSSTTLPGYITRAAGICPGYITSRGVRTRDTHRARARAVMPRPATAADHAINNLSTLLFLFLLVGGALQAEGGGFVGVDGTQFVVSSTDGGSVRGTTVYFSGFNAYWLMTTASDPARRGKVVAAFRQAADHGLNLARTWAFSDGGDAPLQAAPGVYDEAMFQGLDFVVAEARRHGVYLLLCLTNNFHDFGGKRQYVRWAARDVVAAAADDDFFYNSTVVKGYYKNHVKTVLTRVNGFTGVAYRDDPTILGWELMNEPRCDADPTGAMVQLLIAGVGGGDGAVRQVGGRQPPGDGGAGGVLRRRRAREQAPQPVERLLRHQLRGHARRAGRRLRHHPPVPGRLALGPHRAGPGGLPRRLDAVPRPRHRALPRQAAAPHRVRQVPPPPPPLRPGRRRRLRRPGAARARRLPRRGARLRLRLGVRRRAARRRRVLAAPRRRHGRVP